MGLILKKIKQYWWEEGILTEEKTSLQIIKLFENKYRVIIPEIIKNYFLQVGGMHQFGPSDIDEEGFSFWPFQRIVDFYDTGDHEEFSDYKYFLFFFADYLTWSWAYAVAIESGKEKGVFFIGYGKPIKICDSFLEFFDLYLNNDEKLYGPDR